MTDADLLPPALLKRKAVVYVRQSTQAQVQPRPDPPIGLAVADPVMVTFDSVQLQPDSAIAAPGLVGMTIVKVKLTDALPSSTTVNLTVTVNGKISSPVSLPLQ